MGKIKNFASTVKKRIVALWNRFKALSRKKKIVLIIIIFVVLFVVGRFVSNATKDPGYTLVKVEKGSVREVVSESGNITTANRADIFSPTNGIVTEVHVENGDVVSKNQILFEVESTATEQERQAAQANYLAAVSSLNSAKANADSLQSAMFSQWQTFKETAESDRFENSDGTPKYTERAESEFHIAEKNWTAAEKNFQNAQTSIASAQSNVASTKLLLDATKDSKVKATTDGVVENLSVSVGSGVTINQTLAPVRPVLTLLGDAQTELTIKVGESDISKLKPSQKAIVDVTAIKDKNYSGKIVRVDRVGTDEAGVIRYNAYVLIEDADGSIKPGMSADADVITKEIENVLVVPNSAVKPYQGGKAVRVVGGDEFEYVPVVVGVKGQKYTEILEGLKEGQEIISSLSNDSIQRPGLF